MEDQDWSYFALIVPKRLVKRTKDVLEAHGKLDKHRKIRPVLEQNQFEHIDGDLEVAHDEAFFLPVTDVKEYDGWLIEPLSTLLRKIGIREHIANMSLVRVILSTDAQIGVTSMNPLASTIVRWIHQLIQQPSSEYSRHPAAKIVGSYSWTYMIYSPMLLLPPSTSFNLSTILSRLQVPKDFSSLYPLLCEVFNVTHIALNAPIPGSAPSQPNIDKTHEPKQYKQFCEDGDGHSPNILRSPTGLTPLYGDFGPAFAPSQNPTVRELSSAFWCTAQQNGIFQTWAPRYTMFSRGNISEKARILTLASLEEDCLRVAPSLTSAVDLYAGIGYFAFSYAKAGVGRVLCWEINPWSVEGLRRGATKNRWAARIVKSGEDYPGSAGDGERLLIFEESNEYTATRIKTLRPSIPPVRHVNCGLLPTSLNSWKVAVQVLDPSQGGWVHVHENIAKKDIEVRKDKILGVFNDLTEKHLKASSSKCWQVKCEHIEKVKSYAPGVMHCVLDIAILPWDLT